jgi:hypothetical protein
MKKTLLFISLIAATMISKAQIDILYQGNVVAESDTIVINEKSPNDECMLFLSFKNNQDNKINVIVSSTHIYGSEGIRVESMCAGACVPGTSTSVFSIEANETYDGFDAGIAIDGGLPMGTETMLQFTIQDQRSSSNNATVYVKYVINQSGINALAERPSSLKLYPNPVKNIAQVSYELPENSVAGSKIEVRNMLGSVVKEVAIQNAQGSQSIDVSSMPNGVYLCSIVSRGKVCQTKKMIIKH